jgi:hypothetical protein
VARRYQPRTVRKLTYDELANGVGLSEWVPFAVFHQGGVHFYVRNVSTTIPGNPGYDRRDNERQLAWPEVAPMMWSEGVTVAWIGPPHPRPVVRYIDRAQAGAASKLRRQARERGYFEN